jgi:RNA-directed DNA polymerase
MPLTLLQTLTSEAILDEAYAWLCRQRKDWPDSADVWDLRRHWATEKARLQGELRTGTYQIGLLTRTCLANGQEGDLWSARDALVMKALTLVFQPVLTVSPHCMHLKGHGGLKGAIRTVLAHVASHPCVFKTDVQSYYASIDHHRLLDLLAPQIAEPLMLNLIGQYLKRRAERGGLVWEYRQGIALGCPLSPLLGAALLTTLDDQVAKLDVGYVRYMDDILVMAPTRWKLRRAIRLVKHGLATLGLTPHPEKTWVGKAEQGFDFLGYHCSRAGVTVACATVTRCVARMRRLYEQERRRPSPSSSLGVYVSRWWRWAQGGLPDLQPVTSFLLKTPNQRRDPFRFPPSPTPGSARAGPCPGYICDTG